jgi:predicted nucleotidyltransferase
MNLKDELFNQINVVQNGLRKYYIKECSIFGSRLKGNNTVFSDLDISILATPIIDIVSEHPSIFGPDSPENATRIILDEAGENLARQLNLEISINVNFSLEEYENELLKPSLKILVNGEKVHKNILEKQLDDIRSVSYSKKEDKRDEKAQSYHLLKQFSSYSNCARFFNYIKSEDEFLAPSSTTNISMRNKIINSISTLSSAVDKVESSIFSKHNLSKDELFKINQVVKAKQIKSHNFNSLDLGWNVCCEDDLSEDEIILFSNYFFDKQKLVLLLLSQVKELDPESSFYEPYYLYTQSLMDKTGFISHITDMYYENYYQAFKTPFLDAIDHVMNIEV